MSIRKRLDDRGSTGQLVVVAGAGMLAACAVVGAASPGGFEGPRTALAFAAFIALGEVVRITLPGGRDAAPIATAGALAYTLLTTFDGGDVCSVRLSRQDRARFDGSAV